MTRFIFALALIFLVIHLFRRMIAQSTDPEPERGPRRVSRGAPRALVCGECGTQFEPQAQGWNCPTCGK